MEVKNIFNMRTLQKQMEKALEEVGTICSEKERKSWQALIDKIDEYDKKNDE
jgi:hypothetical protein